MQSLSGKVALVTGGSRGIGLAIARALAADGVQVAVTGRSAAHLSSARPKIEAAGPGGVETLQADVRRYDEVERAIDATVARFGGLDFLINNAGIGIFADVASMTPGQWTELIETNLTGVYNACHAALPHLRARGGGFIINISSLAGKNPFKDGAAYCASKAGLNAFSEALMQEVRYDNIRVSYVMPGSVATAFSSGDETKGADWKIAPEDVGDVVVNLLRHHPRSLPSRVELRPSKPRRSNVEALAYPMSVFTKHRDTLERHETMMGPARGRLAVALDLLTDSLALVGQHGVYCRSDRFPGQPKMDIALVLEQLDDAKQLVQSAMETLKAQR